MTAQAGATLITLGRKPEKKAKLLIECIQHYHGLFKQPNKYKIVVYEIQFGPTQN